MALSKNWSIVFPVKVLCPYTEKKHKNDDMKIVVLNLNVFGFPLLCLLLMRCKCIQVFFPLSYSSHFGNGFLEKFFLYHSDFQEFQLCHKNLYFHHLYAQGRLMDIHF